MEKLAYEQKLVELRERHKQEISTLKREYAHANSPYKIGDIIQDNSNNIIKIEKLNVSFEPNDHVECVYLGTELKKDLTPKKSGKKINIWQSYIVKKLENNL